MTYLTTTPSIEGKRITRYCGIVAGEAVLGANVFKDMFAGIRDLVGGRSGTYEKELRKARQYALDELGEGIGDQVIDVLEIVGRGRQGYLRLGRHSAMAHGAHAIAHDDAHGGIENRLTALLAALTTGLAALVLDAFGDGIGCPGGIRGRGHGAHGGSTLYVLVMTGRVMAWTGKQKAPFRLQARHPAKSPRNA